MDWVKLKTEHARLQREVLERQQRNMVGLPVVSAAGQPAAARSRRQSRTWPVLTGAAWIVTLVAAWLAGSQRIPFDVAPRDGDTTAIHRAGEHSGPASREQNSAALQTQLGNLEQRIKQLHWQVGGIDTGLTRVLLLTDSLPATASGPAPADYPGVADAAERPTERSTDRLQLASSVSIVPRPVVQTGSDITSATADAPATAAPDTPVAAPAGPAPDEQPRAATGAQDSVDTTENGTWVINLASLPDKTDAENFAARARARDIAVELQAVTVKGRDYWRVQVVGFPNSAAARARVDAVKQSLGLKDVWVMKR